MPRSTYTFATLPISPAAYTEIATRLRDAGYDHAFTEADGQEAIDMHGIALTTLPKPTAVDPIDEALGDFETAPAQSPEVKPTCRLDDGPCESCQ